jgi:membrane protein YqaA with SNARE-associated domain
MPPDAAAVSMLVQRSTTAIVAAWTLMSCAGCLYAFLLGRRARRDVRWHQETGIDGAHRHVAYGNLRRVQVRLWMFVGFVAIGLLAFSLAAAPPGLGREVARLAYVLLFLAINLLLLYNAWADEHHDRVLRVLLRKEARRP